MIRQNVSCGLDTRTNHPDCCCPASKAWRQKYARQQHTLPKECKPDWQEFEQASGKKVHAAFILFCRGAYQADQLFRFAGKNALRR